MLSAIQVSSSPLPAVTIADLHTICCQMAATQLDQAGVYHPGTNQLFFFTLLWAVKETNHKRKEASLPPLAVTHPQDQFYELDKESVMQQAQVVAEQLTNGWVEGTLIGEGAKLGRLKAKDDRAWELLRIQMEKALRRYQCPQATKDDALANALLKVIELLKRLPDGQILDQAPDIFAYFVERQTELTSVYNFSHPFYAFAAQIARRALFDELNHDQARQQQMDDRPLSDWEELLSPAVNATEATPDWDGYTEQQLLQLRGHLIQLLLFLDEQLPPRQRQVSLLTLAARSQFWLASAMTELPTPAGIHPPPGSPEEKFACILAPMTPLPNYDDKTLAKIMNTNAGNVAALRAYAKERIYDHDPWLGQVWETLVDPNLSNRLDWWPEI